MDNLSVCRVCREQIHVMIRRGTGICSILCEKYEKNELSYLEWADAKNDPSGYLANVSLLRREKK